MCNVWKGAAMVYPAPYKSIMRQVQRVLTPELRNAQWTGKATENPDPMTGLCYVASEALYHMLGGKEAGWTPRVLNHETWPEGLADGETHWFLRHASGEVADPTASQFGGKEIPYENSKGVGFLTKQPSKRAQIVIDRVQAPQYALAR